LSFNHIAPLGHVACETVLNIVQLFFLWPMQHKDVLWLVKIGSGMMDTINLSSAPMSSKIYLVTKLYWTRYRSLSLLK